MTQINNVIGLEVRRRLMDIEDLKHLSAEAQQRSLSAEEMARLAELLSRSTKEELDQIVIEGDSSVEAAQARVDAKGEPHTTLKKRLDEEYNETQQKIEDNRYEITEKLTEITVSVKDFGAVGDGVNDDRQAIQDAIDYVGHRGGGEVYYPYTERGYIIGSGNNEYGNAGLVVKYNNVTLKGTNGTRIFSDVELDYMIYFPTEITAFRMEKLRIEGGNVEYVKKVDHGLYSDEYIRQSYFYECFVHNTKESGMTLKSYSTTFDMCRYHRNGRVGLSLNDSNYPGTSIVLIGCGSGRQQIAYEFNNTVYSSFISCYGDSNDETFVLKNCEGISFIGCGTEHFNRAIRIENSRWIDIPNFYLGDVGSKDDNSPYDFLVVFDKVIGGHLGPMNKQVAVADQTYEHGKIKFKDCEQMTFKYGSTVRRQRQVEFDNSHVTILDDIKTTTSEVDYFIDPVNGEDYSPFTNNGMSLNGAYKTLTKTIETIPKTINHTTSINLYGDVDEVLELKNISASEQLYIDGRGHSIKNINLRNVRGSVFITNCVFDGDDLDLVRQCQSVIFRDCTFNNEVNVRGCNSIIFRDIVIEENVFIHEMSTVLSRDNSGGGSMTVQESIIMSRGSKPSGDITTTSGGQLFE